MEEYDALRREMRNMHGKLKRLPTYRWWHRFVAEPEIPDTIPAFDQPDEPARTWAEWVWPKFKTARNVVLISSLFLVTVVVPTSPLSTQGRSVHKLQTYEQRTILEWMVGIRGRYAYITAGGYVQQCGPLVSGCPHGEWESWYRNQHWVEQVQFGSVKRDRRPSPFSFQADPRVASDSARFSPAPQPKIATIWGGIRWPRFVERYWDETFKDGYSDGVRSLDDYFVRVAAHGELLPAQE